MPTYEYECNKCGHEFERFQRMTDKPLERCPKCRGKVRRLLGIGAGLIFKGSGFYETDYKRKGTKEAEQKEKSETKTTVSKSSDTPKKTDSK